jgi:hypothetical protein
VAGFKAFDTYARASQPYPHLAICLYHYSGNAALPDLIVSGTIFQFVCISSITKNQPLDPARQIRLNHNDPNTGLNHASAACVDFAPSVVVRVEGGRHVLDGVRRLTQPVVRRVPASPDLQSIIALFNHYWSVRAAKKPAEPGRE